MIIHIVLNIGNRDWVIIFDNFSFKGYVYNDVDDSKLYERGSEFFEYLFLFLDSDQMIDDFYRLSQFNKFEYRVPLEDIYFEDFDDVDNEKHLLVRCLQHLYFDKYDPLMNINENIFIGFKQWNISQEYLVSKSQIL